jgi:hypothetical protein
MWLRDRDEFVTGRLRQNGDPNRARQQDQRIDPSQKSESENGCDSTG